VDIVIDFGLARLGGQPELVDTVLEGVGNIAECIESTAKSGGHLYIDIVWGNGKI
jgi:hypothetical protein